MSSKVSVIIPTHNRVDLLPRAINSVLNQTFQDFELIIVDDGSTDNTKQVVEEFQKKDKRIKYIWQENFGGTSKTYNTGLKQVKGDFIAFLEHDDEWLPQKLEKQLKVLENLSNNAGLIACEGYLIDGKGSNKGVYKFVYEKPFITKNEFYLFFEKWQMFLLSLSTVLIKTEVIKKIGLFDEKLKTTADIDFYFRVLKNFDFYFLKEPLINYSVSQESLSRKQFWLKSMPEYKYLLEKYKEDFENYPNAYSKFLRNIGTFYLLEGNSNMARNYFKNAILKNPRNIRLYPQYILSFFPFLYRKILLLKREKSKTA